MQNRSISRLVLFSIVLVSLLPVGIIAPYLYKTAWEHQRQQLLEKHQLLAQNLAEPLKIYVNSHRQSLQILASTFNQLEYPFLHQYQELIDQSVHFLDGFNAIAVLDLDGRLEALSVSDGIQHYNRAPDYSQHPCFGHILRDKKSSDISNVHRSFITGEPVIVISQAVNDSRGQLIAILFAELDIHPLEIIRSKVAFGIKGHGAIVDSKGRVLAHPNPEWVKEIRDISDWPIVQKMIKGETGVMEFYSSFMKAEMVAGYAGIKDLGWGVMVPQPKSEIEKAVNTMMAKVLRWSVFGILIAVLAAYLLARWITKPINTLAANASRLELQSAEEILGKVPEHSPMEVRQLWQSLSMLINRLRSSNNEIAELNDSLKKKVEEATAELRSANTRLQELTVKDHLTEIGNRRYFENTLNETLSKPHVKNIGIMLLDVDNFKQINDKCGHAAGDYVLTRVAEELYKSTRPGDIVARYGGDEFVAHFICDEETLLKRAEHLRLSVEKTPFIWDGKKIHVTLSIGILSQPYNSSTSIDELMSAADHAMYQSKQTGRNKVSKYH
ncbi:MAG: diguanylate cyclase [Pseudomonadota bacterium]|nr:diguanylate cyclase [Pseudomonadota bacterium]